MEVKYDVSGIVHEQSEFTSFFYFFFYFLFYFLFVSLRQISNLSAYGKDGTVHQKH